MINVNELSYTYTNTTRPAVNGLNFHIERGEIFGFLGPSGAGKSTTQKVLIGLLRGFQGRITVFERDLSTWDSAYYERIGVSFEVPNHYLKLTALEKPHLFPLALRRRNPCSAGTFRTGRAGERRHNAGFAVFKGHEEPPECSPRFDA